MRVPGRLLLVLSLVLLGVFVRDAAARTHVDGGSRLSAVVAKALPAVVSITTREIDRDQFNRAIVRQGLGSGFIVDARGHVLTNHHVVDGATEIKVALADGRRFRATLVGTDRFTDLAVLRIEGAKLPVLPLGSSKRLRIAETVIAVGSPLWIEGGPTVTVGVVSATGRSMEQEGLPFLHNLLQTDAAINPGNSGGPLLDISGRAVGINTAVISSAHGIGFAIAIDEAKPIVQALIAHGRIERASLGVTAVTVTPQIAWANDLPIEQGALVIGLDEGGPAASAGLAEGDVVVAFGGRPVADLHHLHEALVRRRAGDAVELSVWRDGKTLRVPVELGAER